jgi:hypothetical protein
MKKEKPQITQMNADKENPSAPICAICGFIRNLLNQARGLKGVFDG